MNRANSRISKKNLVVVFLSFLLMTFGLQTVTYAADVTSGGQVTSKSTITFLEGEKPIEKTKEKPSEKPGKKASLGKPTKILPQTGEKNNQFNIWASLIGVLLVCLFLLDVKREETYYEE